MNNNKYNFDLQEIKKQVESVIKYSQGFSCDINADNIIQDWFTAKKDFIDRFKGSLIYQHPELITFHLDEKSKKQRVYEFANKVLDCYNNTALSGFLYDLNIDDFYNNKTSKTYTVGNEYLIPKNFKVIKAFKFFIKNKNLLTELQNKASQIIQEDSVKGYLCLSVHPLDYLSASDNVHNWRSCHALDGEYRVGNLNYMMDSSTIICYLRSEKDEKLPFFPKDIPWNSKKWRVWLYFSESRDMMFAGRQYPFSSDRGINYVKDNLLPTCGLNNWSNFYTTKLSYCIDKQTNEVFHFEKHIPVGMTLKPLKELVKNGELTFQYNDLLYSSCYDAMYAYEKTVDYPWMQPKTYSTSESTRFSIGKKCKCPICNTNYINQPKFFACTSCINKHDLYEDTVSCDSCGVEVNINRAHYVKELGEFFCDDCYNHELVYCEICGKKNYPEEFKYIEEDNIYLCKTCFHKNNNIKENE